MSHLHSHHPPPPLIQHLDSRIFTPPSSPATPLHPTYDGPMNLPTLILFGSGITPCPLHNGPRIFPSPQVHSYIPIFSTTNNTPTPFILSLSSHIFADGAGVIIILFHIFSLYSLNTFFLNLLVLLSSLGGPSYHLF